MEMVGMDITRFWFSGPKSRSVNNLSCKGSRTHSSDGRGHIDLDTHRGYIFIYI